MKIRLPRLDNLSKLDVVVSVLVGLNFAVASPTLDFLGQNPEVFTSQDAARIDVGAVVVALTIGIPLVVGLLAAAAYGVWRRLGVVLHGLLLVSLLTLFIAQVLDRATPLSAWPAPALLGLAAVIAVPPTLAYFANRELRTFVRFGLIVPIALAVVFAFLTPAGTLLASARAAEDPGLTIDNPAPVAILLFDALPVVALMDGDEHIDAERFPSFARLAADATWFRNATTHHAATRRALPGMLAGIYADDDQPPALQNFPDNLFALLAEHYRPVVFEPWTALCPETQCARVERQPSSPERWVALGQDVGLLGLHAVLPDSLGEQLPPAEQALGEFAGAPPADWTEDELPEQEAWNRFLTELRPDGRPGLHFFHWMKPHFPWHGLPSGQQAIPPPEEPNKQYSGHVWRDDWTRVAQWQRELLQVGYVDRLLGEFLDGLQDAGIYDDALVIVASDHGEAFTVGQSLRQPADGNLGEIAFVPLFVKVPQQKAGTVIDDPVELVDVYSTALDVLDVQPAPDAEGRSLFGPPPDDRERTIIGWHYEGTVSPTATERREALARRLELFGAGAWDELFRVGRHGDLHGRQVAEIGVAGSSDGQVRVDEASRLDAVDPTAPRVPTILTGQLRAAEDLGASSHLAIALNGRIAAVVEPYGVEGASGQFIAVIPRDALVAGNNALGVFEVRDGADGATLWSLAVR